MSVVWNLEKIDLIIIAPHGIVILVFSFLNYNWFLYILTDSYAYGSYFVVFCCVLVVAVVVFADIQQCCFLSLRESHKFPNPHEQNPEKMGKSYEFN